MALVLFMKLNTAMVNPMHTAMPIWTFSLIDFTSFSDLPAVPRMSTVKDVVNAVNAEPPAA